MVQKRNLKEGLAEAILLQAAGHVAAEAGEQAGVRHFRLQAMVIIIDITLVSYSGSATA